MATVGCHVVLSGGSRICSCWIIHRLPVPANHAARAHRLHVHGLPQRPGLVSQTTSLRKNPQADPLTPGQQLTGAVQAQATYRSPAKRCFANDAASHLINLEVLTPAIKPRMEQSNNFPADWIHTADIDPLVKIAGTTRQRQIGLVVFTALRYRDYVLHFEAQVEHQFRRMTVFAAMESATRDRRVTRVHPPNSASSASALAAVARNSTSTSSASSACSVAGSEPP